MQREMIITSLFRKLTKYPKNNLKIDIKGISNARILFLHKSLIVNQSEILSHVVAKTLHRSYRNADITISGC